MGYRLSRPPQRYIRPSDEVAKDDMRCGMDGLWAHVVVLVRRSQVGGSSALEGSSFFLILRKIQCYHFSNALIFHLFLTCSPFPPLPVSSVSPSPSPSPPYTAVRAAPTRCSAAVRGRWSTCWVAPGWSPTRGTCDAKSSGHCSAATPSPSYCSSFCPWLEPHERNL